jgi:hypothetical protein
MGALAVSQEGRYLQVNGDYVSSLNANELRRAVQSAKAQMRPAIGAAVSAPVRSATPPVVVIKRRKALAPV